MRLQFFRLDFLKLALGGCGDSLVGNLWDLMIERFLATGSISERATRRCVLGKETRRIFLTAA